MKKKVLFVAPKFGVTSEVWMYRQATQLNDSIVSFICRARENGDVYPANGCQVYQRPNFHRNPQRAFIRRAWSVWNRMINAKFDFFDGPRAEIDWWREQVRKVQPDITLFQYGTEATRYAGLLRYLNHPYAVHFHGFDLSKRLKNRRYRKQIISVAQQSACLIVVAQYMRDWLIKNAIDEGKIHIIPYGVPMDEFAPEQEGFVGTASPCVFLMVGRLTPKKAPLFTIRAFERCYRKFPNSCLRIVGGGELEKACKDLVTMLGIENAVSFVGPQPSEVVRREMRRASVFVQHSLTPDSGDKEGWPVSVAEAAASGLPIVSTRHASIPDQVVDGETGLLSDEGDWMDMSSNMLRLAEDLETRKEFGQRSRLHISQWDLSKQISTLASVLHDCI